MYRFIMLCFIYFGSTAKNKGNHLILLLRHEEFLYRMFIVERVIINLWNV